MALDLSAPALINAAGGLFFAILGLFSVAVGKGTRRAGLIGVVALGIGVGKIVANLTAYEVGPALWVAAVAEAAACIGALLLVRDVASPLGRRDKALLLLAAAAVLALFAWLAATTLRTPAASLGGTLGELAPGIAVTFSSSLNESSIMLLCGACALRVRRTGGGEARAYAYLALGFGLFATWNMVPRAELPSPIAGGYLVYWLVGISLVLFWILATQGPEPRLARNTLFALLAPAAVAMAIDAIYVTLTKDPLTPDHGGAGITRTVGALFLSLAILRHGLLGVELPHVSVKRGPILAGAFAVLLIVTQIMQNFFAARYGLILGGVVAGAFLFAAQPLQRLVEGTLDRPRPRAATATENERVYLVTLRKYLRDGHLSREEEVALMHLADELGISARRAVELRHEIEAPPS